ncbi:HET-domain-containing protein [Pyrenochaeta sp. DS3sAY3a]|nr:HET-domain-containing protein [Pyrenochaeta sp. DS3sAY3a]
MRLLYLDLMSQKWMLQDFSGPKTPCYGILSHTWSKFAHEEVTFEDISDGQRHYNDASKPGYDKLRFCQQRVEEDGLRYFWIDTCCIKKSDSTELQRSLASMFYWYQRAVRCYVYLADVSARATTRVELMTAFTKSTWFKRGWTLQELIAPECVEFYTNDGVLLGTKKSLPDGISEITGIPKPALIGEDLSHFSIKERLSWASRRVTTVPEDAAYCMIGIFDVEVHMLYAEGDYNKRKTAAMNKLRRAISESGIDGEKPEHVIRIGGASWSNLVALGKKSLQQLDDDLDQLEKWFLEANDFEWTGCDLVTLEQFTELADMRMHGILEKLGVHYDSLSRPEMTKQAGKILAPRPRLGVDENLTRLRESLGGLPSQMKQQNYDLFMCLIAFRTLIDLKIWRGRSK